MKRRRIEVEEQVRKSTTPVVSIKDMEHMTAATWTAKMAKEEQYQNTKRARRLMEALASGVRPRAGMLADMTVDEIVGVYKADQERLRKGREKKTRALRAVFAPRVHQRLDGKLVKWFPPQLNEEAGARTAIRDLGLRTPLVPRKVLATRGSYLCST